MGREVSESCVDSLLTEMVSTYCHRFYANKPELAARRIEAIGYQVGHQLSERYSSTALSTLLFVSVNCMGFLCCLDFHFQTWLMDLWLLCDSDSISQFFSRYVFCFTECICLGDL